ncbi:MAG: valine--tRNA ligase [Deltaproteobacteria bacterium]|nr:valine--tRNA ligase [Deltaproteobacteria bacterium]MBW1925314.1 valine--tRNA ligase [Deltaproteobacteria bacterium]
MSREEIAKSYEPQEVEHRWYRYWEEHRLFEAETRSEKDPYCIVIPPPNVTGTLHMGHALNNTLQDILIRYKKMKGFNVLWQPGTDHAGIATQNVVEKDLAAKGTDRHTVGREKFIELVWEWREKYGGLIINQLKRLGCACDWSRERFTMDEGLSRAVREVFVRLYDEGLIYRGDYIINWCPRCHTALADLEVEHEERDSHLYYVRYPLEKGDGHLIVATTRPETLLGDTAVAVNPEDERYQGLSGVHVLLPILDRPIPVIFDRYVDTEFGTGALKITPAHDPYDFEIGETHGLKRIKVIDEDGRMNELAGPYRGMDRFECREKILADLEARGLLEKIEPYRHSVGHCYRCKTMIEPLLSKQWFVRVKPLAEKAIQAVKEGRTKIYPTIWEGVYFDWMENIRDWCISRQIWWGHRIPAWYCEGCGEVVVAKETPETCPACSGKDLIQETDVLDTWFSSALWPFSTLGWPDETEALKTFYPTSLLVTGFDILFFWVARMMMMGLHFMGDVPFRDVYIHALVRDAEGKKMSKSKGNVIDPLQVMDRYGTDAFRFTLAAFAAQGRDIKMSEERIEGYRHFVNKIWNAARFVLMNLEGDEEPMLGHAPAALADRWIRTRLGEVSEEVSRALEEYRFNDAAGLCYQFVWHEFCDWYLEMAKQGLYGGGEMERKSTRGMLCEVLMAVLKLLHPFMPFVTEELWQRLPGSTGSIMEAAFPEPSAHTRDREAADEMKLLMGVITGIRNVRGEMRIPPSKNVSVVMDIPDPQDALVLRRNEAHIMTLAKVDRLEIEAGARKPEGSATAVYGENQIHVLLKGLLDFGEERKRLRKEIAKVEKEMAAAERKLGNRGFLEKAPAEIVAEVRERVEGFKQRLEKLTRNLEFFDEDDA